MDSSNTPYLQSAAEVHKVSRIQRRDDVQTAEDFDSDDAEAGVLNCSHSNKRSSTLSRPPPQPDDALIAAVKSGTWAEIPGLLAKGADINYRPWLGTTALESAIDHSQTGVIRTLLRYGADLNAPIRQPPLTRAAMMSNEEVVRLLLDNGAKLDQCDRNGETALSYAIECNKLGVARLLLEYGAHVDAVNFSSPSPFICAVLTNQSAKVRTMLEDGADPNENLNSTISGESHSALYLAATIPESRTIFLMLLKYGADVNAVNQYHETALHTAAKTGSVSGVLTLLDHEADANTKSHRKGREGFQAIDYAELNNEFMIITALKAQKG